MLNVTVPSYRLVEATYVLKVLLDDILGLEYSCRSEERKSFGFTMPDHSGELLVDAEFLQTPEPLWLTHDSMPNLPLQAWNPSEDGLSVDLLESDVPLLFGEPGLLRDLDRWHLKADLFGGAFFMLSRYEELVLTERDHHERFPACASLAFRQHFLDRPIVDEYAEILWTCLSSLWPGLTRKSASSQFELSCDVDQPFDCTTENFPNLVRACSGDLLKRASPAEACRRIQRYILAKQGNYSLDRHYSFDWYLDRCEDNDLCATFYFIADSSERMNGCYSLDDPKIKSLLRLIYDRGHRIGLHGNYQSYTSPERLQTQKNRLQNILLEIGIDQPVLYNRQHYLRWDAAVTADYLQQAGFEYDSTGSYADASGFRYGTAHEFAMWGWASGGPLALRQRPLIVMDSSVLDAGYLGLGTGLTAFDYMDRLRQRALRFGGNFSLLWHNSTLRNQAESSMFLKMIGQS